MLKRVKRRLCKITSLSPVKIIDFEIIKILEMIKIRISERKQIGVLVINVPRPFIK